MKILYISPDIDSGGAENILFNIVKSKGKKDIFLVSLTHLGYYGKKLQDEGYKIYSLNTKKNLLSILKIFKLYFLILRYKPDIVHTWLYHANLIGGILSKIAGVKKIFWSIHHDYEYSNYMMMIEMKILIFLSHCIPCKIIFCSSSSKLNHIKKGYKDSISEIINNGVSTIMFKPNLEFKRIIRKDLKVSDECLLLGNISRYHPIKDHENLFRSLIFLKRFKIDFKCLLIGKGLSINNKNLVLQIKKFNLSDNIILFGESKEINKLINSLDLHILSSKNEAFPMVLLESMSSGVPCLSTNVGDAKAIVGETGWIVAGSDPFSMASTIIDIAKERSNLKNYSSLARQRILNYYSLEKMIESYNKLYK